VGLARTTTSQGRCGRRPARRPLAAPPGRVPGQGGLGGRSGETLAMQDRARWCGRTIRMLTGCVGRRRHSACCVHLIYLETARCTAGSAKHLPFPIRPRTLPVQACLAAGLTTTRAQEAFTAAPRVPANPSSAPPTWRCPPIAPPPRPGWLSRAAAHPSFPSEERTDTWPPK